MRIFLLVWVCLWSGVLAEDSPYLVKSWTTADGLPQNTVEAIAQTSDGYIWAGTRGGLARFDGVQFTSYGLADGLKSVYIVDLLEDGGSGLWIATAGGGLSHYQEGAITTLTTTEGLAQNTVLALAKTRDGSLWVGGSRGLQRLESGRFTMIGEAEGLAPGVVSGLATDRDGVLWVATDHNLYRMREGRFEAVPGPGGTLLLMPYLLADREGFLWASIGNGRILRYREGAWAEFNQEQGVPFQVVYSLTEGADGAIWAGSGESGLHVLRDGRFQPVAGNGELDPAVREVKTSRDGIIWVGTRAGGLSRVTPRLLDSYAVGEPGRQGQVNGLSEDPDGQLWVTTYGGGLFHGPKDGLKGLPGGVTPGNPFLHSGLRMRNGDSWFLGPGQLLKKRAGEDLPQQIPAKTESWISAREDEAGTLWLGTAGGELWRVAGDVPDAVEGGSFGAPIVSLASEGQALWLTTFGKGLFRWEAGQSRHWGVEEGLPTAMLQALHRDAAGTLWIGTAGGGLAWLRDGEIRSIDARQGLGDNSIVQILEDDGGHLWLGCHRGIFRVTKREIEDVAAGRTDAVHPLALDEADGMPVAGCTGGYSPAGLRTRDGTLLFPTVSGLVEVDPKRFQEENAPPVLLIEDVLLNGSRIGSRSDGFVVPPGPRELEIRYTAFAYSKPSKIRFRYRLEGLDKGWTEAGSLRSARFPLLPPGTYRFLVSAANPDGRWSGPVSGVSFTVKPFFWQTPWFRAGMVALLMTTGGLLAAWRSRSRLRRSQEREQLARAEAESQQHLNEVAHLTRVATLGELSSALAHELNQPLAAILGNAQVARRDLRDGPPDLTETAAILDDIADDAKRAGGIIHGMRAMFKKEAAPEPQAVDLNEAVTQTMGLLHSEIVGRKVKMDLHLSENLPPAQAGRVEIQQVLINLVLNALDAMNGSPEGGRIVVVTSLQDVDKIELSVHDGGPGIPPEMIDRLFEPFVSTKHGGLGLGLAISRGIAGRFHGKLLAENHPEGGAVFRLILPISDT
ncbi:two-component regulator propeller domain-containing protein [Luteolibacter sp. Populi]|uniref:two-component regulator propeller domain-containing protein n=1 Tax=Luteolibacter sp. Populi TaxID=3230487 RepID=UPI0034662BC6